MKHRINRKGFSLPMSVVFMLVVSMLCLVLLSAALAAAKQVNNKKLEKQAELNVTSTSEVLSKELLGMSFEQEVDDTGATVVTVIADNGNAKLADSLRGWIEAAENSATNSYELKGANALTIEEGSVKVEAEVTVYSSKSKDFPGDIIISLSDKTASTTGYKSAFRLDGKLDTGVGTYCFSDMTFYSGSGVYK